MDEALASGIRVWGAHGGGSLRGPRPNVHCARAASIEPRTESRRSTPPALPTTQGTPADNPQNSTVSVWLYEQLSIRIEGKIRVRFPSPTTVLPSYH